MQANVLNLDLLQASHGLTPQHMYKYRVIQNDCQGFNNFIHNTLEIAVYVFFYLIEQHSKFLLHTL